MPLQSGQILNNRYRIVNLLGQGGFGAVYRAWDLNLQRPCAFKENLDTAPEAQRQFFREATLLSNLTHPNLPRVTDHFSLPGQGQYLVMDYVEGEDLEAKLAQAGGKLPESVVLPWLEQVSDALRYLHSQNPPVIHRDIKPANIRITKDGHAMLVDFGIAKAYDPSVKTTLGARAVTPGYSPPEQYGHGTTDARSDVYALGATLYTALTGHEPPESVQRTIGTPLPAPRSLNPAISPVVEAAMLHALALAPTDRLPSMAAFWRALTAPGPVQVTVPQAGGQVQGGVVTETGAKTHVLLPPASPLPWKWIMGGAGIVALGLMCFAGFFLASRFVNPPLAPSPLPPSFSPVPPTAVVATPLPEENKNSPSTPIPPAPTVEEPLLVAATTTPRPSLTPTATEPVGVEGMVQVFIPAGDFWMGGPAEEPNVMPDEQPRHEVSLDAFWMDLTEVTNAMFAQFVADTGYRTEAEQNGSSAVWNGGWDYVSGANWRTPFGPGSNAPNNYPVIQVSWNDASAYCEWAERRLPTEAEWEKAASGPDNFLYPWGNAEPRSSLANYADNVGSLVPVGSYPDGASGYGVLDMGGNVYEWTADWHGSDYYSNSPPKNPTGPTSGKYKVIHGGSWQLDALRLRVFVREVSGPNAANSNIGFRCVQSDR